MGNESNVALAFCYGAFQAPFVLSLIALLAANRNARRIGGCIVASGLFIEDNRNRVVSQFLEDSRYANCEWLWFLDTDIGFAPNVLERLLAASEDGQRKIVAANYYLPLASGGTEASWLLDPDDAHVAEGPYGAMLIEGCGMGCTIIHRQVLADVAEQRKASQDPWVWFARDLASCDGQVTRCNEDITFCLRARQAGHRTWGLRDLVVEHYKLQAVPVSETAEIQPASVSA